MDENPQNSEPTQEAPAQGSGNKTMQIVLVAIVVLVLVGGGIYFLSQKKQESPDTTAVESQAPESTPAPIATASPSASVKPGPTKAVSVSGSEYAFTPAKITVNKNDHVKLTFKNAGKYPHNFVIDELSVTSKTIKPGESDTVEFTPTDSGSFTYYCSVPGHKDRGMVGTLVVK